MSYTPLSNKETEFAIKKAYKWNLIALFNSDPDDTKSTHKWQDAALSDFQDAADLLVIASATSLPNDARTRGGMAFTGASSALSRTSEMTRGLLEGLEEWEVEYDKLYASLEEDPSLLEFKEDLDKWEARGMPAMVKKI